MILSRKINLNQFKSIVISQQNKIFLITQSPRTLHNSSFLTKQSEGSNKPSDSQRIYYGSLTPQIRAIKVFSLTTSIVGVCAQPILYEQASKLGSSTPAIVALCGVIGFFTFITPIMIHFITKKYITELYYDQQNKEYIAIIMNFFLMRKQIKFTPEEVIVPDVTGAFTSFHVKTKDSKKPIPLFLDPRLFEDPTHYIKIMGYDKPIDFKLSLTAHENNASEKK